MHGNPSFGILPYWGNSFSFIRLSISQCCKHNIVNFICILEMLNLPVCRLLCLCGAIIRLYGSTNGAQRSTAASWILPAHQVYSVFHQFHILLQKYLLCKSILLFYKWERHQTITIIMNSIDQWSLIHIYSNSPMAIFGDAGSQAEGRHISMSGL